MKKREINRVNHNHETKPERRNTHTHPGTVVVCCCSATKSRPAVCVAVKAVSRSPSGQEKAGFTRGGGRGVHLYPETGTMPGLGGRLACITDCSGKAWTERQSDSTREAAERGLGERSVTQQCFAESQEVSLSDWSNKAGTHLAVVSRGCCCVSTIFVPLRYFLKFLFKVFIYLISLFGCPRP